jgi:hypothetical protein
MPRTAQRSPCELADLDPVDRLVDLFSIWAATAATRRVAASAGIGPSIDACQPTGSPENEISVSPQRGRWSPQPDATAQSQSEGVNTCNIRPFGNTGQS